MKSNYNDFSDIINRNPFSDYNFNNLQDIEEKIYEYEAKKMDLMADLIERKADASADLWPTKYDYDEMVTCKQLDNELIHIQLKGLLPYLGKTSTVAHYQSLRNQTHKFQREIGEGNRFELSN